MRRIANRYLFALVGVALLFGGLDLLYSDFRAGGVYWFNIDKERNVVTWFSGCLFFLFGLGGLAAWFVETAHNRQERLFRYSWLWGGVALIGFALSLDEITILHENIFWKDVRGVSASLGGSWVQATQWQIVFAPLIFLLFAYVTLFLTSRFGVSRRSVTCAIGGLSLWVLALFFEGIRSFFKMAGGYRWEVLVEEELEMLGAILLFSSILHYVIDIVDNFDDERKMRLRRAPNLVEEGAVKKLGLIMGLLTIGAIGTVVVSGMVAAGGTEAPKLFAKADMTRAASAPWFSTIKSVKASEPARRKLAAALALAVRSGKKLPGDTENMAGPAVIFLSVGDGAHSGRSFVGRGETMLAAAQNAVSHVRSAYGAGSSPSAVVKVDFVTSVTSLPEHLRKGSLKMKLGLDGIAFSALSGIAYPPAEVMGRAFVGPKRQVRFGAMIRYEKSLGAPKERIDWLKQARKRKRNELFLFRTESYADSGAGLRKIYRGHDRKEDVTAKELVTIASDAIAYLVRTIDADGRFTYKYRADRDETSASYSILRHAGTIYSMLELYGVTGDKDVLAAAKRALGFLGRVTRKAPGGGRGLVWNHQIKVGGNGLYALALAEYIDVTGDKKSYLPLLSDLAKHMAAQQREDGSFVHIIRYPSGEERPYISVYYPGEAMLGMVRAYRWDGNEKWLDVAERNAHFLIDIRDKGLPLEKMIHDHWLLYALNDLYRYRPRPEYRAHAAKIVTAIVNSQHRGGRYPDWRGGYYKPPRSTPTATRSEGLCAASSLFSDTGSRALRERALRGVKEGILFQIQTVYDPLSALYVADPARVMGAVRGSLTSHEIRIDYVQHSVSSFLCLADVLAKRQE